MAQVTAGTTVHDVVVIGSGAGGGTMTKVLADLGVSVLLIEAGPMLNPADLKEHMWPYQAPHRGAGPHGEAYTGGRTGFTYSATYGGAQLDGEPYTVAPGSDFSWFRSRILGGRTNHYGRVTLRMADYDFKPRTTDGLGLDWPISYDDLAPYYDKAERFIGVTGIDREAFAARRTASSIRRRRCARTTRWSSDRARSSASAPSPARQAVTTVARNGRPPCHYCGQCGRGCMTASNYASSYVQIFPAMQTGRVQVHRQRDGARADHRRRPGKSPPSRTSTRPTGAEKQVRCRTVVLAASACESARLLLNSKSPRHPQGLANSSGKVGRYLMDTVGSSMSARCPRCPACRTTTPTATARTSTCRGGCSDKHKTLNFPRGYHIEVGGGYGMPGIGSFTGIVNRAEGYGLQDEAGHPRRLRHVDRPLRPRRDDPERAVVLRDRSGGEGQLGHPGAPVPLGLERPRAEPGPAHAADLPRDPGRRWAARSPPAAARGGGAGQQQTTGTGPQRGQQAPQTGQAGPQTGQTNAPAGQPTSGGAQPAQAVG